MSRLKKPAKTLQSSHHNKEEVKKRIADEDRMKGASDKLENIPNTIKSIPEAKAYYDATLKMLEDSGILSNLDRYVVGALADSLAKIQIANDIISQKGDLVIQHTKAGDKLVVNPAYQIHDKYMNHFNKLASQLGLSPSSRAQLSSLTLDMRAEADDDVLKVINEGDN